MTYRASTPAHGCVVHAALAANWVSSAARRVSLASTTTDTTRDAPAGTVVADAVNSPPLDDDGEDEVPETAPAATARDTDDTVKAGVVSKSLLLTTLVVPTTESASAEVVPVLTTVNSSSTASPASTTPGAERDRDRHRERE
jgi:hypothetical protein